MEKNEPRSNVPQENDNDMPERTDPSKDHPPAPPITDSPVSSPATPKAEPAGKEAPQPAASVSPQTSNPERTGDLESKDESGSSDEGRPTGAPRPPTPKGADPMAKTAEPPTPTPA
jgi:hypothetical protein